MIAPVSRRRFAAWKVLVLLGVGLIGGRPPDAAAAQSFQGTFSGDGMVLTLQPSRGRYLGTLVFDGRYFAVEASAEEGRLAGVFTAESGDFDFEASFAGDALELETNTVLYLLRRSGKKPPPDDAAEVVAAVEPEAIADRAPPPVPAEDFEAPEVAVDEAPAAARVVAGEAVERDGRLAGSWSRQPIAADGDGPVGDATEAVLRADGSYALSGETLSLRGSWRTEGGRLLLRTPDSGEWRECCRYRLVADTLLLSFEDDSRQLWHR